MASPPTITVQAPHSPTPHPYLGPLMFNTSRSTHRRGISGDTSIVVATLLTFILMGICSLHNPRGEEDRSRTQAWRISNFRFLNSAQKRTEQQAGWERGLNRDFR